MEINPNLTENAKKDYHLVVRAVEENDQHAYADLMNRYREPVYFMILKMTNSPADAEDLTIEAFGKAFKNLPYYSSQYAFSTWLFRIASNNCIDYLRKKQRSAVFIDEDSEGHFEYLERSLAEGNPSPEEYFIKKERLQKIQVVIEKLKPHYRKLVQLRYIKEYSYEEIAEQLQIPIGTVKAKLFRAREFLQNLMDE